ncbi:hypothetical protein [Actinocrispum wychmicini]|uniref:Uncharacterized protein n=1 Tax=Actinocrispum wychmicini TaxID=1213861 RepID=A0A4R2JUZ7_9PSEU|nr:hypothetical protein [Actinocrispum wychmicini]TCO62872.1 hypothetical protein EV192_1021012 [Actinocrispum wychmicini]
MTHPTEHDERITVQGLRVVELFTACLADPDDLSAGEAADRALAQLDALLRDEPTAH